MVLETDRKKQIIKKFGASATDTGTTEVQVALLTDRLRSLNEHFSVHGKDHHSKRGLLKLVGQRRRLLTYLARRSPERYSKLMDALKLRK